VVARLHPEAEFLAMQYGMKRPLVEGRKVYMVDFGLPAEGMRALRAEASEFIWIDHHASQVPVQKTLGWGTLDTNECGTSLTWKLLFPDQEPPPVVAYIRDKDLWQWKLPDSRAIAAGLEASFPKDLFAGLLDVDLARMAERGRPLIAAQAARIAELAKKGIIINDPYGLSGIRALAVATKADLNDLGAYICLPQAEGGLGYDLAILYYQKPDRRWVHSLRSTAGEAARVDCAAIATARGGGGHLTSACYTSEDPLVPPGIKSPAARN
jgi:uncharacterized protein